MTVAIRVLLFFVVISVICGTGGAARAEPKPWVLGWWPGHWHNLDFKPYLEDPKAPHNGQWKNDDWQPEDWVSQRTPEDLVNGFYHADIIRGQYEEDGVPVLEVGSGFYRLGGQDKRRVAATLDYIYGITAAHENGMFMLYDAQTDEPIGSYTRYGLQLQ